MLICWKNPGMYVYVSESGDLVEAYIYFTGKPEELIGKKHQQLDKRPHIGDTINGKIITAIEDVSGEYPERD